MDKLLKLLAFIKQLILDIAQPQIFSLIIGIILGYILRTPIRWLLDIMRFVMKL